MLFVMKNGLKHTAFLKNSLIKKNAKALQTEKQEAWNPKYKKKNQKQNKNTKHKPQNKQNCADTRFWMIYFAFFSPNSVATLKGFLR